MNKKLLLKSVFVFTLLLAFTVGNAQIAVWNYEPSVVGASNAPTANVGTGTSSIVNPIPTEIIAAGTYTGTSTACASGAGTAWAFTAFDYGSVNESNGAQFNVSTVGKSNILFTWDQQCSNAAANTVRLMYTTDGATWIPFTMTNPGNTTICNGSVNLNGCFEFDNGGVFRRISVDFSAITAVNNNANFGVRLLASQYQSTGQFRRCDTPLVIASTSGTWRFDNVTVSSTTPAPNLVTMNGTAGVCLGNSIDINVTFTGGTAPFTLVYTDNVSMVPVTINNYTSGTAISVMPASNRTYTVTSLTDGNTLLGTGITGSAVITVTSGPPLGMITLNNFSDCLVITPKPATFPNASGGAVTAAYYNAVTNLPFTFPYSGPSISFYFRKTIVATGCYTNSATYNYTRNVAPVVSPQPSTVAQSVCQGESFSPLGTGVSAGSAPLTYQWWRNIANSNAGGVAITIGNGFTAAQVLGANTATYTPASDYAISPPDYYYYATIGNACTTVKTAVSGKFTITQPTVAGSIATTQTICAGTAPADLVLSGNTGTVVKWERANDLAFSSGVADIVSTSTTLTSATIGTLTQTTFFRAYVQNGTCTVKTTVPIQVLIKSTSWVPLPGPPHWTNGAPDSATTAIFTTDYSSSGDLSACAVQITSGDVVFNAGHTLSVENTLAVSGGTLTFEDTASLLQGSTTTTNSNSGNIVYKRTSKPMRKFDYTYWSSPVDSQSLVQSPTGLFVDALSVPLPMQPDKYYWFDTSTYLWANPLSTTMDVGLGYIIRAPLSNDPNSPTAVTATFRGKPNNGTYPISIVKTGIHDLNCIGNPYPSAISADEFVIKNAATFTDPISAAVGTTFYFWTHNSPINSSFQYVFSDYAVYNFSGGSGVGTPFSGPINSGTPNGLIAAGQSFVVKGIIEGTTPAAFKNSMRLNGSNNFFFRTQQDPEKNRVWLEFKNSQGVYKQILVGYIQNATDGYDNGYDGEALETGNPVAFYSILADKKLAIQGKALPFVAEDQVALGFRTTDATEYEISLSNFDGLFTIQNVYLEDQLLHVIHNLKESPYAFVSDSGTFDTRFILRFNDTTLGTANPIFDTKAVIVYKNQNQLFINSGNTVMKNVKIFDISGRLLLEKNNINAKETAFVLGFTHEVLMVQITSVTNEIVTKKVIN